MPSFSVRCHPSLICSQLIMSSQRLVRFLAKDGRTYYGDAILPHGTTDIAKAKQAKVIRGEIFGKHDVTDQVADIRKLLAPLAFEDVKTVRCLGLNYEQHAKEVFPPHALLKTNSDNNIKQSNMPIPTFPILFYKPITSLSGPTDPIPIHPLAQQGTGLDYECELVAIIGRACANVPESSALDHVLGYAIGNDVSHRDWQLKHGGGQWSLGKGFDAWAPYGPGIVSTALIPDPQNLEISTKLNGETVQRSN
ncbi:Fumarylacetoacetate hydrolase domain-containing protein, partial [Lachnellula willkommii]